MAKPKKRVDNATPAEAFLNTAQQYHLAATTLLSLHEQVASPLYFLYTHALELALKAYLRSHVLPTPLGQPGHALQALFEQCQRKGLQVHSDLRGVIDLLESENELHGFRYFVFKATASVLSQKWLDIAIRLDPADRADNVISRVVL